ncbi:MAG: diguanylate cyclase [Longimicrobiaceae bacterium]
MSAPPPSNDPASAAVPAAAAAVDALNRRAWELRYPDPAEGLRIAVQARAAADAAGYARGRAYALLASGACRCRLLEYDDALAELEEAGRMFEESGNVEGKANTLIWIGSVHWRRSDHPAALQATLRALALHRAGGDREGEGESRNNLGNVYYHRGDMARALEHFTAVLQISRELDDRLGISHAVNNIGNIHGRLGQYARALEHHERALLLKREVGDVRGEGTALVNVGTDHESLEDYPRALEFYTAALEHCRLHGDRLTEAGVLCDLGDVQRKTGAFGRALTWYREAVDASLAAGTAYHEAEARIGSGLALAALGDAPGAVAEIAQALALAERIDSRVLVYEAHLALSEAYEAAGDAAKALEHFRAYHRVEDEVFSAEAERRIQAVLVKAEVEASQREAELLRRQAGELERLSREDSLTGLFNRRHVDAALALEWERASRFGRDLTVAMADIDHFKAVNDRFSHAVGDEVLRRVGEILRGGTRAVDVAGRWGGEEFVLLLVETPPERAAGLCEKLRAAVEAHDWSAVAPGLAVTLSLGVAGNGEAADPAALLAAADARLYQAKRAGRNRVVSPD